jgi:hypothetical protein
METRKLAYWVATGLFCSVLAFSGIAHFTHLGFVAESMAALGYPEYFMTILGLAKLLGVVALLAPGRPLLKEWAYAGFAFNLLGATASHAFAGDALGHTIRPAIVLMLCAASYLLRPPSRRLAAAPSLAETAPAVAAADAG